MESSRKDIIYLDHCATTPLDEQVLAAMMPWFQEEFGNPASVYHEYGATAEQAVGRARGRIAALLNAAGNEIVFTSGATEANNIALIGTARANRQKGRHVITCQTEHHAALDPCRFLQTQGFEVTYLPVDGKGILDLEQLNAAIQPDTILISLMAVNNETGVLHPLEQIGRIAREHNVLFHTDATQAIGKISLDVQQMSIDLLSLSGHKFYGPKGIGALYVRGRNPRVKIEPILFGGGHERGLRSGTLNVPGIVGLGEAARLCRERMAHETERLTQLADTLLARLKENLDEVVLNGHPDKRLGSILNLSFPGCDSETLMLALPKLAVSSGAACTTAEVKPSHVLTAMGLPERRRKSALRISLGRPNTTEQIDRATEMLLDAVQKIRDLSARSL